MYVKLKKKKRTEEKLKDQIMIHPHQFYKYLLNFIEICIKLKFPALVKSTNVINKSLKFH